MTKEEVVSTIVEAIMDNPSVTDKAKEPIICDVCGESNPSDQAICKMCSNYLKRSNK